MFRKLTAFGVGVVIVLGGGAMALKQVSPSAAGRVEALIIERVVGWNEDTCTARPEACLTSKFQNLRDSEQRYGDAIQALRAQQARIAALVEEQDILSRNNESLLREGREILQSGEKNSGQPIMFARRSYPDSATLRLQLETLFAEKSRISETAEQGRELAQALTEKLQVLMIERANIKGQREMIPGKLALLRANRTLGEIGESLLMIDEAMALSETRLREAESLMGTTRDLMISQMGGSGNTSQIPAPETRRALEDFLREDKPATP